MFDGRIDHPLPVALLLAAFAASLPAVVLAFRAAPPAASGRERLLGVLGALWLAGIWLVLVPLNALHHLQESRFAFVFGSELRNATLVDQLAAANLAAAVAVAVGCALLRPSAAWLKLLLLACAVMFGFTALEEAGLDEQGAFAVPTDVLGAGLVSPLYAAAGLAFVGAGLLLAARSARAAGAGLSRSPFTLALVLTTGVLLQHPVFEELAELAFSAAALHALLWLSLSRAAAANGSSAATGVRGALRTGA